MAISTRKMIINHLFWGRDSIFSETTIFCCGFLGIVSPPVTQVAPQLQRPPGRGSPIGPFRHCPRNGPWEWRSIVIFGSLLFVVVGQFDNLQKWWFHGGFMVVSRDLSNTRVESKKDTRTPLTEKDGFTLFTCFMDTSTTESWQLMRKIQTGG